MKKVLSLLFLGLFLLISVESDAQTDKVVRILAIGNSFSEDAVEQHLHDIAAADGMEIIIGNMYIGGCTLQAHLDNARENRPSYRYRKIGVDGTMTEIQGYTIDEALSDEQWDYVSLQQQSGRSGLYETWAESLPQLLDYVKARLPKKTRMMLHQTWAYAETSDHGDFRNYDNDQMTMYNAIVDAVDKAAGLTGVRMVIPSGTAVQNARATVFKDKMTRDGYHLHMPYGRYTVACTWYEKILRRSVVGNTYIPDGMTAEQVLAAQKAAHAAVRRPDRVTNK